MVQFAEPTKPASRKKLNANAANSFTDVDQLFVVGVGALTGEVETFSQCLTNFPNNSCAAFVVVQDLEPPHKGKLPALLQRSTNLTARQVADGMVIKPNNVYVIPPNLALPISRGALHRQRPVEPRGLHVPIGFFFHSLAQDMKGHVIGVMLVRMGADGMEGFIAIKGRAGFTRAQQPESARFNVMPCSAINFDLDSDVISNARRGFHDSEITSAVSPERSRRFFIQEAGGYRTADQFIKNCNRSMQYRNSRRMIWHRSIATCKICWTTQKPQPCL